MDREGTIGRVPPTKVLSRSVRSLKVHIRMKQNQVGSFLMFWVVTRSRVVHNYDTIRGIPDIIHHCHVSNELVRGIQKGRQVTHHVPCDLRDFLLVNLITLLESKLTIREGGF